jgi:diguanylate cyclase (GGDEF)-like protein/PAS domain S-box-containing protein
MRRIITLVVLVTTPVAVYGLIPSEAQAGAFTLMSVMAVIVLIVGVVRGHPERPLAWRLLTAGIGLLVVGDVVAWFLTSVLDRELPVVSMADWVYLSSYPFLIAGSLLVAGVRGRRLRFAMIDGALAMVAIAAIVWELIVAPGVDHLGSSGGIVLLAYPAADVIVLASLLAYLTNARIRGPAAWLLFIGVATLLLADIQWAWLLRTGGSSPWTYAGWLLTYVCFATAALDPSMRALGHRQRDLERLPVARVWLLGLALLVVPALLLTGGGATAGEAATHAAEFLLLAFLVMLRLASSAKELSEANRQARSAEARFRNIFSQAQVGVFTLSLDGLIVEANEAAGYMLRYPPSDLTGLRLSDLATDDESVRLSAARFAAVVAGEADDYAIERTYRRSDGTAIWVKARVSLVRDADGSPLFATSMFEDVTDRRAEEESLRFQALHDPLTRLPNRELYMDRLEMAVIRARRSGRHVGVIFFDLDGFKPVNDTLGHEAGDEVLREFGIRLGSVVRGSDTVARIGGDEFAALAEGVHDLDELRNLAERLLVAASAPFATSFGPAHVSASIGIVMSDGEEDPIDLLRRADVAMYGAKRSEPGTYRVADPARTGGAAADDELAATAP